MVILGTLYLFPEAIFNSQLVSLVGLGTPSAQDVEHLELFGRVVSGIGLTLLMADLLPVKMVKRPIIALVSFTMVLVLVWPITFFGQKYLVENIIVERSTAQQRQHAVFSAAIRDALASNVVNIKGVQYDPEFKQSPASLTFLSLFGGMLYADPSLSDALDNSKHEIIYKFVQKRGYEDFEEHYQNYTKLYDRLSANYQEYAKASTDYNSAIHNIPKTEAVYWADLETEVNNSFVKYQQAQKAHIAKASARAQKYGPIIYKHFEDVNRCKERYEKSSDKERRNECILKHQARYKTNILEAGIGYIESDYWLISEKVSTTENVANTVINGVLTGGLYTALQLASAALGGDGGIKDYKYTYTNDPDHYQQRFLSHPNFIEMFEKETGYSENITDLSDFRKHPQTQKEIRKVFLKNDLKLSDSWSIDDRPAFALAVSEKIKTETARSWQQGMTRRGLSMPPNLTWKEFQLHPDVQSSIKQHMGERYVDNTMADWNKRNFKEQIIDPNIERTTTEYLNAINSSLSSFEDGGELADYGKQALRSVVIPPISMFLSLFLICLTLAKLPGKYWSLFTYNRPAKEDAAGWILVVKRAYMPVIILLVPLLFLNNTFTNDKNSTANYFLTKVEESSVPLVSYLLKWTLHTQPYLHPLGSSLETSFGLYDAFQPFAKDFHHFDVLVMKPKAMESGTSTKQKQDLVMKSRNQVMLNITVDDPETTKIQIMNIGPAYSPDMVLAPGIYDIKITFKDGRAHRQNYQITAGYHELNMRNL